MATSSARLEEAQMDHLRWTLERLEGKKARANQAKTTLRFAKLAEKPIQENVGMQTNGPRARTKEKENLTRKERIPRESQRKEKLRTKNAVYVENCMPPKTAGTMGRIRIPNQKKVEKATEHQLYVVLKVLCQ